MSKQIDLNKLYVIAEAAQGYEGNVELAKILVKGAASAKADAIKFQVVYASDLCEQGYQYYELFKQLEMSVNDWQEIRDYAKSNSIDFIMDVFGEKSLDVGVKINADGYKLHSTTFFDSNLAGSVFAQNKLTFVSVGGIEIEEIEHFIQEHGLLNRNDVMVMFGFQSEPTPIEKNNMLRIKSLKETTGLPVGFMDHSDGCSDYAFSLSALALGVGVRVFEKHISLDRILELEDYISALSPDMFFKYVGMLRGLVSALGNEGLELTSEEYLYRGKALKRIVANCDIKKEEVITLEKIRLTRPATDIGFQKPEDVIGLMANNDINEGSSITEKDIAKNGKM